MVRIKSKKRFILGMTIPVVLAAGIFMKIHYYGNVSKTETKAAVLATKPLKAEPAKVESPKADPPKTEPQKSQPAKVEPQNAELEKDLTSGNFEKVFSDDVFMGDSISEGLSFYDYLDEKNVDAKKGMSIVNAKNEISSIVKLQPKKVYILYGINDMNDTVSSKWFIDQYRGFIDKLKAQIPQANIYIQSILPISPSVEKKNPHLNNKHISECNAALIEMAKEENVSFINIASLVNPDNTSLYEGDGTHFKAEFYPIWLKYVAENSK